MQMVRWCVQAFISLLLCSYLIPPIKILHLPNCLFTFLVVTLLHFFPPSQLTVYILVFLRLSTRNTKIWLVIISYFYHFNIQTEYQLLLRDYYFKLVGVGRLMYISYIWEKKGQQFHQNLVALVQKSLASTYLQTVCI